MTEPIAVPEAPATDVESIVQLAPDPSLLNAIGRGHSLPSALADLIDNSIDAHAERVRVRFVVRDSRVESIEIHDDGTGMGVADLEKAMTLGSRREYAVGDLGYFGLGLKASSMSQAGVLTVFTRCGHELDQAMRLRRDGTTAGFGVERLTPFAAAHGFEAATAGLADSTGTVVVWTELDSVSEVPDGAQRRKWLEATIRKAIAELGLVFHRILSRGSLRITFDVYDADLMQGGIPLNVSPSDPFDFRISGKQGYPRTLTAVLPSGASVIAACHIIPANASSPAVKVLGRHRKQGQGLYLYRSDRLISFCDWLGVRTEDKDLQLCRVAIDLTDGLLPYVQINPEKRGAILKAQFVAALSTANDYSQVTFAQFLDDGASVYTDASVRRRVLKQITPVGLGLPDVVLDAMGDSVGFRSHDKPVSLGWRVLDRGRLFALDHEGRNVWLNAGYRRQLAGPQAGSRLDAPLLKAMLHLLFEELFTKSRFTSIKSKEADAWQKILAAAMAAQINIDDFDVVEDDDVDALLLEWDADQTGTQGSESLPGVPAVTRIPLPSEVFGNRRRSIIPTRRVEEPNAAQASVKAIEPVVRPARLLFPGAIVLSESDDDAIERLTDVPISSDSLNDFLRQVGKTPLLSADEEVELAQRVEAGVFAEERLSVLNEAEKCTEDGLDLAYVAHRGRSAYDHVVRANLRLVLSIVKVYHGRGLDLADLVQEGNIGLMRAVSKFDYTKGFKFSTYATWWIRQAATRALADTGRMIRIPVHAHEKVMRVLGAARQLSVDPHQPGAPILIAALLEMSTDEVVTTLAHVKRVDSLDAEIIVPIRGAGVLIAPLGDFVIDDFEAPVESGAEAFIRRTRIDAALETFPEKHASVVRMRFGLDGQAPMKLDAIGRELGLTRERIRQIEGKVLKALRAPDPGSARDLAHLYDGMPPSPTEQVRSDTESAGVVQLGAPLREPTAAAMILDDGEFVSNVDSDAAANSPLDIDQDTWSADPASVDHRFAVETADGIVAGSEVPGWPGGVPPEFDDVYLAPDAAPQVVALEKRESLAETREVSDYALLRAYISTSSIDTLAAIVEAEARDVITRLTGLILSHEGDLDDESIAPRHGERYEPDERQRLVARYQSGQHLGDIAFALGRTPLAIAWQLLDSPARPVKVSRLVLQAARRRAKTVTGEIEWAGAPARVPH